MRYDLIITGETHHSQQTAQRAARANLLVAMIRTTPLLESIYQFPLEQWDWRPPQSWTSLKDQFRQHETSLDGAYAREGIDLFEGEPLQIESNSITLSTRSGEVLELKADCIETHPQTILQLPSWLQLEVPHVTPLPFVTRLPLLPKCIMVEGNSLPALRFAVMCARLNRKVMISYSDWNSPEFAFELDELEDEATQRGILRLDQQEMLSVSESSSGDFNFWLMNGDTYRTGLYVFATENQFSTEVQAESPNRLLSQTERVRDLFPTPLF